MASVIPVRFGVIIYLFIYVGFLVNTANPSLVLGAVTLIKIREGVRYLLYKDILNSSCCNRDLKPQRIQLLQRCRKADSCIVYPSKVPLFIVSLCLIHYLCSEM